MLKKSESQHEQPEDGTPFGPLTQRLLQALVEVSTLHSTHCTTNPASYILHCTTNPTPSPAVYSTGM